MLDAANEALEFIHGKNRSDLDTDRMLVLSLVKELEIIGEVAKQSFCGNSIPEQRHSVARYQRHAQSFDSRLL
jgi:uncharacterized protein with HEPN domain